MGALSRRARLRHDNSFKPPLRPGGGHVPALRWRAPAAPPLRGGLTQTSGVLGKSIRMPVKKQPALFIDKIRKSSDDAGRPWAFARVPPEISRSHLRRGRITASILLGKTKFDALMEPDGELGHWFRIPAEVKRDEAIEYGQEARFALASLSKQPDPQIPASFSKRLASNPVALATWEKTSVLAKIDWIHWMESAKQAQTRNKRQQDAIDMLQDGKVRVCCFDPSGFYSKSFSAPHEDEN